MLQSNPIFMVILLVVLLSLSAFFSGSETALMAISRLRLAHLAKAKPLRAKLVERILKKPERLIGTILLGNNLVNVAMSAIATAFAISLWGQKGIAYVTGVLTIAILVFAEITPKVYAKYFNERVSFLTAPLRYHDPFQSGSYCSDIHHQQVVVAYRCGRHQNEAASHNRRRNNDVYQDGLG